MVEKVKKSRESRCPSQAKFADGHLEKTEPSLVPISMEDSMRWMVDVRDVALICTKENSWWMKTFGDLILG